MKRLIILCLLIGLVVYFYKDGQRIAGNVGNTVQDIGYSLKRMLP
jgi:hypothetical protein